MKRSFICAFSILLVFSFLFTGCQEEVKHQGNEIGEGNPISLTLSLTGDFLEVTESPLSRASQSDNLYGLQIYSSPVNEDSYTAYGYGLFYGGTEIKVDLPNNLKYKIEASVVIDGKNQLYHTEKEGEVFYNEPFLAVADNLFHEDKEYILSGINKSEGKVCVIGENGEVFLRPELDRYYGEISEIYPNNYVNNKVELEAKRVVSGLKLMVKGLKGTMEVLVENGPVFVVENSNEAEEINLQKIFSLYGENGVYTEDWFKSPKDELNIKLVWNKIDGTSMTLYDKTSTFQRKVNYNFNIDLSKYNYTGDEHEIVIILEDGDWDSEEEIDLYRPVSDGSILLSEKVIYLSEVYPSKTVGLMITPSVANWISLSGNESVAAVNLQEGMGNTNLSFTQGVSYDNTVYKFANMNTFEYDSVFVGNLFLSVPSDTVKIPATGGTVVIEEILALGGDFNYRVLEIPNWVMSAKVSANNELVIEVDEDLNTGSREGVIVIAHVNDENYRKEIYLQQSQEGVFIGDCDYVLIKFFSKVYENEIPSNLSHSYAAEIMNSGVDEIDGKAVGYLLNSSVMYDGQAVIRQANTNPAGGQYMATVLFNLSEINDPDRPLYELTNRFLDIDVYGYWGVSNSHNSYPLDIEFKFYRGGRMVIDAQLGYINEGGITVYEERVTRAQVWTVNTWPAPYGSLDYRTTTKVISLIYDKVKKTATLVKP